MTGDVERLIAELAVDDPKVRQRAAEALGHLRDEQAHKPLAGALVDAHRDVRSAAAAALGSLGVPGVEPLLAAIEDGPTYEACFEGTLAIQRALGSITDILVVELLVSGLKHAGSTLPKPLSESSCALGEAEDVRAAEVLIAFVVSEHTPISPYAGLSEREGARVRKRKADLLATVALARIGEPAVEPLIAALKDDDSGHGHVRKAAVRALGEIGDARAVDPLTAVLGNYREYDWVRSAAAKALGQIGDTRAIEPLAAALGSSADGVAEAASEALRALGHEPG